VRVTEAAITCLIADDHPSVLRSIGELIREWGFTVVATTSDGADAQRKIEELEPAVALVDVRMPGVSGVEIARDVTRRGLKTAIVIYTGHDDHALVNEALDAGARGFVLKEAPLDDLQRALRTVAAGGTYVDPVAGGHLLGPNKTVALSPREREILRLLADGLSNDEIGARLFISGETVRTHVKHGVQKLGAKTRTQAVALALRSGIIA
jgi:DNA-binding NarL/FixJ family response regulator